MMDNFYLKFHRGEKQAFFKNKELNFFKSKSLKNQYQNGYNDFDENLLKSLFLRQLLHAKTLCKSYPKRAIIEANSEKIEEILIAESKEYNGVQQFDIENRLAIGLGNTSIFETSITLHHIYGFPYIPASTVKGLLRSWVITNYFLSDDNDVSSLINAESNALANETFCLIFGCSKDRKVVRIDENRQPFLNSNSKYKKYILPTALATDHIGNIVFFDAYPINAPNIQLDIMNPHYPKYYQEKNPLPPSDWQNPIPIFFLTLKKTLFHFIFGIRKNITNEQFHKLEQVELKHPSNPSLNKVGNTVDVLAMLLKEALTSHGIGAKTAVGYGYMTNT